jgi:biopolymer transport protein ExbB
MLAGLGGRLPWIFALVIVLFMGMFVHRGGNYNGGTAVAQEAAPAGDASGEAAAPEKQSLLAWTFKSLGWRYTISFLALSFALVALFIMNLLAVRRDAFAPAALVDTFEQCLNEKKWQEAYDYAKGDSSFLGQMLAAGLEKLSVGYPQAIEAMQEVGEEENMKAEHRLSYIALIGTIAPMVGLLGTVDGMILSFNEIATSPVTPKPSELAEGISTALVTTLVGLLLAIPAIGFFNITKNRIAQLVLESGILAERLMSRFESGKR